MKIMNNSVENGDSKVYRNKRKSLFKLPLFYILLFLGMFVFFYTVDAPFVIVFICSCCLGLSMFLWCPIFTEPLKIEENEDSLICHLFYGKKVVSLTGDCAYYIRLYTDGGWFISFSTGLLPVAFSNDSFPDFSKIVDKLKDCPNSKKRNPLISTIIAIIGIVFLIYGGAILASGHMEGLLAVLGGLSALIEIAKEILGIKKQPEVLKKPNLLTFMEWVVMILTLFPLLFAFMIFANEGISVKPAFALIAGEACICVFHLNYQKKVKKGMGIMISFMDSAKYLILFFSALGYLVYHFVVA